MFLKGKQNEAGRGSADPIGSQHPLNFFDAFQHPDVVFGHVDTATLLVAVFPILATPEFIISETLRDTEGAQKSPPTPTYPIPAAPPRFPSSRGAMATARFRAASRRFEHATSSFHFVSLI